MPVWRAGGMSPDTGRRMRGSGVRGYAQGGLPEALFNGTAEEERILTLYGDS